MTVFVDTAVLMYASGPDHPLRASCRAVILRIGAGSLLASTSVEVLQEILHRFVSIRRPERGIAMARDAMDLLGPILPVTHQVMTRVPTLIERYPGLATRDLVHVATCLEEAIDTIVTTDVALGRVAEVRCVHPAALVAAI